jgi:Trk K+ transport system NAD-binding subunit
MRHRRHHPSWQVVVPRGATELQVGDEVLAVTDRAGAARLAELFAAGAPPEGNAT